MIIYTRDQSNRNGRHPTIVEIVAEVKALLTVTLIVIFATVLVFLAAGSSDAGAPSPADLRPAARFNPRLALHR